MASLHRDAVVLDGYDLPAEDVFSLAEHTPTLCIADHGVGSGQAAAAIILDQNLGAARSDYPAAGPSCRMLLGPRYALLRRDVVAAARGEAPYGVRPRAERLLVALGGDPAPELRRLIDDVAAHPSLAGLVRVDLEGLAETGRSIATADLALATAGSTAWELAAMGVPAVLIAIAPNQRPVARRLAAAGAAIDVTDPAGPGAIAEVLAELAASPDARAALAAAGRRLVDGNGSRRVAAILRGRTLDLRPADAGDEGRLWEWRNDPVVRAGCLQHRPHPLGRPPPVVRDREPRSVHADLHGVGRGRLARRAGAGRVSGRPGSRRTLHRRRTPW